jgi:ribonucleoside-diphosphate reductase alpha chain
MFLSGAKDGSGLSAILEDASVVSSIALQHGIPASALAKSVARNCRQRFSGTSPSG